MSSAGELRRPWRLPLPGLATHWFIAK
jgi:hypothetical protein